MKRLLVVLVAAAGLAVPGAAQAVVTQVLATSESEFDPGVRNQGWWSATEPNFDFNDNYLAGQDFGVVYRDFFSFDLSSACQASRVTLRLTRFAQTGPLTYSLYDVSTPTATLNANGGTSQAIFDDLGTGTSFGRFPVAAGAATDVLSFPLNAAGVAAFNAARGGGFFSIGGSVTEASGYLYGGSGGSDGGTQELVATCVPTTKGECKNGGWREHGDRFKNQGACVSFVATAGKRKS
jgi:hypothetical protein